MPHSSSAVSNISCSVDVCLADAQTPEQRLQSAREEWRAGLDTVLDSDADLLRQRTRADDLKVELIRIQTPPDPTWPVSVSSLMEFVP